MPFFEYVAYTSPHWPLQAPRPEIEKYKGRFDEGWDVLREFKLRRMAGLGIINSSWGHAPRDPGIPAWNDLSNENRKWYAKCMEVYAAQMDVMDQGIGRILYALEKKGELDNTLIFFLSDNGGCNEDIRPHAQPGADVVSHAWTRERQPVMVGNHREITPGTEDTFQTYTHWANLSNAPFRLYKSWVHEGGISTPLLVRWGNKLAAGALSRTPGQLPDIATTIYAVTGVSYPGSKNVNAIPLEGENLFENMAAERALFWEHQGNGAVRRGRWKAVREYPRPWELYDLESDRGELNDLALVNVDILTELVCLYYEWADRCGVLPRERILAIPGRRMIHNPYCDWMI
jgi:arylsulfatase